MKKLTELVRGIRHIQDPVTYNLNAYQKLLGKVNATKFESLSNSALQALSAELKILARAGAALDDLLVQSFVLVRESARRVSGLRPFDMQVIAGMVLHQGKLAEMQTGEGKTLAAVMPAYLHALTGQGVHILTFNDYLACRDAGWMGPIYEFLGVSVGYIQEKMSVAARQRAYAADVTYVAAKEAGFDYLRDFLCMEKEKIVHRPFHFAIVDEADSILIDEARIPLVIAGDIGEKEETVRSLPNILRNLKAGTDYMVDPYESNVYFTDSGLVRTEELLGCGNLYAPHNLELLTCLNSALYAEALLSRDKEYIVRDDKIELVDEFSGRVAAKRHWSRNLQAAVEAKEGALSKSQGKIMGSIALQHYLGLYPQISGMTGTACPAAAELGEFYGLEVVVIPTNAPCIRMDSMDRIFACAETKNNAVIGEIKRIHAKGQPILVGTGSVEESEMLANALEREGAPCQVLNAKNDEMEAAIIAHAGEFGAVTVSTNMAGRGIDIKLGGADEVDRKRVTAVGGLYVLGTAWHDSRRIDQQLRGRAGRQGDPGESRFFVSLEDDFLKRYDIASLIPQRKILPPLLEGEAVDPAVAQAALNGRKMVEGFLSDIRRQLWRYSFIIEQQRRIIHQKRQDVLMDKAPLALLPAKAARQFSSLKTTMGEGALQKLEKQLTLYFINCCWAEYLEYMTCERESIHLVTIGEKDPLTEFHRIAIETFDAMVEDIDAKIIEAFEAIKGKDDFDQLIIKTTGPSSTWTYLVNERTNDFGKISALLKSAFRYIIQS